VTRLGVFAVAAGFASALLFAGSAVAAQPYPLNFKTFDLSGGSRNHVTYSPATGALTLDTSGLDSWYYPDPFSAVTVLGQHVDGSGYYEFGTWTSGWTSLNFPFNELVSSWNSNTPEGTWIQSEVQPKLDNGFVPDKWYKLGRWSYSDSDFHRTSVGGQGDAYGFVSIDTFFTKDHPAVAYRLRLTLYRSAGTTATPSVTRYSAIASNLTNQKNQFPSKWGGLTSDLHLPQYSQETHHGHWPEFDNGGEAWCSPTSTSMVVAYWDGGSGLYAPQPWEMTWVDTGIPVAERPDADPQVDYTARYVYDYHYQGAGNWPFNVAYASERGLVGDVTQLHNLAEAEPFIQDGIPLVASVAWESNKLTGAIKSTNGHLLVIGGFDDHGNVIAYDPAHPTDAEVRQVYDREQFERAWIPASGGIVYVIRPAGVATPDLMANNYRP
jgi:peptidase C39-like protein